MKAEPRPRPAQRTRKGDGVEAIDPARTDKMLRGWSWRGDEERASAWALGRRAG